MFYVSRIIFKKSVNFRIFEFILLVWLFACIFVSALCIHPLPSKVIKGLVYFGTAVVDCCKLACVFCNLSPVPMKEKHKANFSSHLDFCLCSLALSFCVNYKEVLPRRSHLNNAHLSLIITDFHPCLMSFHCPYEQRFYFREFLIKNLTWIDLENHCFLLKPLKLRFQSSHFSQHFHPLSSTKLTNVEKSTVFPIHNSKCSPYIFLKQNHQILGSNNANLLVQLSILVSLPLFL